jgi:hypothetical protein
MAYVDLAHAHIKATEIDEASRAVGDAAALTASCRSDRLVGIVSRARSDLDQWKDALSVRELDQLLENYGLRSSRM